MKLNQAQQIVDDWINEYGVRYFNELTSDQVLIGQIQKVLQQYSVRSPV